MVVTTGYPLTSFRCPTSTTCLQRQFHSHRRAEMIKRFASRGDLPDDITVIAVA